MGLIPIHVLEAFGLDPNQEAKPIGNGLIHRTYTYPSGGKMFIIQQFNIQVFVHVDEVMDNTVRITNHLKCKKPDSIQLSFLETRDGLNFFRRDDLVWRVSEYIQPSISFDVLPNKSLAREVGRCIAEFHCLLADFPADTLYHPILRFHDFDFRFDQFNDAVHEDLLSRKSLCEKQIEALWNYSKKVSDKLSTLSLQTRVAHNDTKLNNILFDQQLKAICLIDLDTVMPGNILQDTGDALRTMCNPAGEDGQAGQTDLDVAVFKYFTEGYIDKAYGVIPAEELRAIPFSIIRMASEQALRFLTDYLKGDIYYYQLFENFNLVAAKVQIELVEKVYEHLPELQQFVDDLLKSKVEARKQTEERD